MADYKAVFAKPRRIASAISSYFVRASNGTDRATSGTYSVASSGTPAFDRKDGLILEAARTNLLLRSSEFDNAAWSKNLYGSYNSVTVTPNAAVAPDGTLSADMVTSPSSGSHAVTQRVAVSPSTTYTLSVWVMRGTHTALQLYASTWNSGSLVSESAAFTNIDAQINGSTFTRVSLSYTVPASGVTDLSLSVGYRANGYGNLTYYLWGAQLEAGAFASTYIPTTSATVTRAASYLGPIPVGDMGIASQNNNYSFQLVLKMPASSTAMAGTEKYFAISDGTSTNRMWIEFSPTPGAVVLAKTAGGATVAITLSSGGWAAGDTLNIRGSYSSTSGAVFCVNAVTSANAGHTTNFSANATVVYVNGGFSGVENGYGAFKGFRIWDTALTQAQLEALTVADLDGTTYLTSWATELGSDPPASVTISDEDITTGSLDWWRFGESSDTSENTKSASYATYLGSSANINTPAFGRYAGSNDKQAPLITYSDGTSPSSGSSRAYSSTGVANAGRRNVVTSQGKPLWIHILAGGYDGVHQHVLTTSDSSSPVHTRTNTTGATTVKFWETIVYWGGANGSTLQIDSTAVSGSVGLQLAAITVFPVDPTITSLGATAIDPGTDLTINHVNFQSAPTSVTYASQTEAFTGSPTTTQSVMTGIPIGDFAPSQSHVATRMRANYSLTLSDGYESASYTVQVDPMVAATAYEDWSTKDATNWYGPTVPATWQTGDEIYGYYLTGYGQVEAGTGWFSPDPLGLPAQGRLICYDISAGQWLAGVNTEIYTDGSTGAVEGIVMAVVRPIVKSVVEVIT